MNFNTLTKKNKYIEASNSLNSMNKYFIEFSKYKLIYNKLDDFIRMLKIKNIHLLLITMPVSSVHYNLLEKKLLNINNYSISNLQKKYHNTSYINFQDTYNFDSLNYMNDATHVNKSGANFISNIINDKVVNIFKSNQ
jgi:hypothetical protein